MNKEKLKPTDPEAALRRKLAWQFEQDALDNIHVDDTGDEIDEAEIYSKLYQKPDEGGEKNDMTIQ